MALSPQERDNLTRWKEGKRGFYEVYYLKWNDVAQGVAGWMRYTILAPLSRPPELSVWAIFYDAKDPVKNTALKNTFPLSEARIERDFFYFAAGPSAVFQSGARGDVAKSGNRMSWELKFGEEDLSFKYFPRPFYFGGLPKTKFLVPYLSTRITGEFTVNDRKFSLNGVPAHQGHLWGTEHANSWLWSNGNTFVEDPSFCFEGLSARIGLGEKISPPLTLLFFYWEGTLHRFNAPWQWLLNRTNHELDRWHFEAGSGDLRFVGDLGTRPEDMIAVRYEDPRGGERFCHHTELADLKIQILKKENGVWTRVKTLTASRSVAFEVAQPTHDPRVKLLLT